MVGPDVAVRAEEAHVLRVRVVVVRNPFFAVAVVHEILAIVICEHWTVVVAADSRRLEIKVRAEGGAVIVVRIPTSCQHRERLTRACTLHHDWVGSRPAPTCEDLPRLIRKRLRAVLIGRGAAYDWRV